MAEALVVTFAVSDAAGGASFLLQPSAVLSARTRAEMSGTDRVIGFPSFAETSAEWREVQNANFKAWVTT
jgi:hypothetical protein